MNIKNKISVGYNDTGQEFFDLLNEYRKYIHSYYFSVLDPYIKPFKTSDIIHGINSSNTYDIPANLLFNSADGKKNKPYIEYIKLMKNIVNLKSVTILDLNTARDIRKKYPELEIHLSVRFFDAFHDLIIMHNGICDYFFNQIQALDKLVDVVNLSGTFSRDNHKLTEILHLMGIKVKYIVNEGCVFMKHFNFSHLNGCEKFSCYSNGCHMDCNKVSELYPWIDLARSDLFLEELKYYDYDILKISSRFLPTMEIQKLLQYWILNDRTYVCCRGKINLDTNEKYLAFLEYIDNKSKCNRMCYLCDKCKNTYELIM